MMVSESRASRRILAIGGGGFLMEDQPSPIDRYLVQLIDRERPRICVIGTPSGDPPEMIDKFYAAFEPLGCICSHLAFFRKPSPGSLPLANFAEPLLAHDAIFVGGGNTRSALAVWREWGLDAALQEAWLRGVLLSGMSAGALCWFERGLTDSCWGAGLQMLDGLGFLSGGCCVHYRGEPERRPRLHEEITTGAATATIAIDDGAAVLYSGTDIADVVHWKPGATAYRVRNEDGAVVEHALPARSLEAINRSALGAPTPRPRSRP
ncbi:MAG: peptidase E [Proteobacteria bacterium]|nr:peptidase E [Pseudomonadota bacterium]